MLVIWLLLCSCGIGFFFFEIIVFSSVNFTLFISDQQFFTPPLKRKSDGICESHVLPLVGIYFFS